MLTAALPSVASAALAATATVDKTDVYLTKQAEPYIFTVNNTSTAPGNENVASLRISAPSNRWTITNCATSRSGWTPVTATNQCTFNNDGAANVIPTGMSDTFTVTATTSSGNDVSSANWSVAVKATQPFGNPGTEPATVAPGGTLAARGWNFEVEDAVITTALAAPTIGAACPAPAKTAPTVSSRVVVVCGRQWGAGSPNTLAPVSGSSSLTGTMFGTAGTFASAPIAYGGASSVVLANYSASTITSTAGTGKTVIAQIGANNKQSPVMTFTGYEATLSPTTVGSVSGSGIYSGNATLTATLNSTSPASGVVSGKSIAFTLNGNSVGSDTTDASGVATVSGVSLAGKDAGTETGVVEATFDATGDPTYTGSSNTGDLTVAQKPIDGDFTADDKTYDRTTTAAISDRSLDASDIVIGDDVSLDPTAGTANFADADVARLPNGTVIDQVVTASDFALTGADQANYALVMGTDNAKINPKPIDASFTTADKVYDGTTTADVLTRTLDPTDIVPGDEALVSLGSQGGADFATADVARDVGGNVIDQVVTASGFQLAGTSADNYDLTSVGTELAAITPKSLGGQFTAADKTYNGTTAAAILTSSLVTADIVAGDDVALDATLASASFATKAAGGSKTVTSSGFALTGLTAGNYALSMGTTTATINPRPTDGSFAAANKQYDGTNAATVATTSLSDEVSGDDVGLQGTATFADASVADDKVVTLNSPSLTGADAGNYSLGTVPTTTANITRRQLTGSFTVSNKVYDGTTAATVTGRSVATKVAGEDVNLTGGTATFASKTVGNGKTVTLSGASLTGANVNNYTLGSVSATAANITAKSVTGSFTAADKDFDGTNAATITGRSLSGAVVGDTVSLTGGSATFSDANPGVGKTVTGAGFALGGADAGNYSLASVGATTATIRQRDPEDTPPGGGKSLSEKAADLLGGNAKTLGLDLGGLGFAFAPGNQGKSIKPVNQTLFAIGGCAAPCTIEAAKTLVLTGEAGASAAATKKIKLKTQKLSLAKDQLGLIKLKLTKKQKKAIKKANKAKLVVKVTLKSGGQKASDKKTYKFKKG